MSCVGYTLRRDRLLKRHSTRLEGSGGNALLHSLKEPFSSCQVQQAVLSKSSPPAYTSKLP